MNPRILVTIEVRMEDPHSDSLHVGVAQITPGYTPQESVALAVGRALQQFFINAPVCHGKEGR